jgi:hypothetical protein
VLRDLFSAGMGFLVALLLLAHWLLVLVCLGLAAAFVCSAAGVRVGRVRR